MGRYLRNRDDEPDASLPVRIGGFVAFTFLAALVGGFLFAFGPYLFAANERRTADRNRDVKNVVNNDTRDFFRIRFWSGAVIFGIGGGAVWAIINRKKSDGDS